MAFTQAQATYSTPRDGSWPLSRRVLTVVAGAALVTGAIVLSESSLLKQGDSFHSTRAGRSTAPVSLKSGTLDDGAAALSRQRSSSPVSIQARAERSGLASYLERSRSTAPVVLGGN